MYVFAALIAVSAALYAVRTSPSVDGELTRWSWGWGFSIWPTLYWLIAAPFGAWFSQRKLRQRQEHVGVRTGTVVPLLVAILAVLVLARSFIDFPGPGIELVAAPVGLFILAVTEREARAAVVLTAPLALAAGLVWLSFHGSWLHAWLTALFALVVALLVAIGALIASPRGKRGGVGASRA